jgi:hypothetical protein
MTFAAFRATTEQWTHVAICAEMKQRVPWATADCLLELRARIAALEAAQSSTRGILGNSPTGSLVERVRLKILRAEFAEGWETGSDEPAEREARAAIREVAAAARLRDLNGQSVAVMTWEMVAQWLEQEANQ